MNFIKTNIEGVIVIEPRVLEDDRGHFFESYNEAAFTKAGIANRFVQDNQSYSRYGVVRGLHCQQGAFAQAKLVRVLQGRILDVAVDIRRGSPTFGKHVACELSDENKRQLFMPRGFLHGFSVLSQTACVLYKCDNLYCKEAEAGVRFDDPSLAIDWLLPSHEIVLSEKDSIMGRLEDVAAYGS